MAYYTVLNPGPQAYDPGFMQNFNAVAKAFGKNAQQQAMMDAVNKDNLIPEYEKDSDGNIKTSYKSPQLVGRGITFPDGSQGPGMLPVSPNVKPKGLDPKEFTKAIQDLIDHEASRSAGQQAGNKDVAPYQDVSNDSKMSNGMKDQSNDQAETVNPQQVYLDAIKQQAQNSPIIKNQAMPQSQTVTPKGKPPMGAVKYSPSTGKYYDKDGNEI